MLRYILKLCIRYLYLVFLDLGSTLTQLRLFQRDERTEAGKRMHKETLKLLQSSISIPLEGLSNVKLTKLTYCTLSHSHTAVLWIRNYFFRIRIRIRPFMQFRIRIRSDFGGKSQNFKRKMQQKC